VESARRDWEDSFRRYEEELSDPAQAERLRLQVRALQEELRKRVGSAYTLSDLASEYRRAEVWARDTVSERAAAPGWPRTLSVVEGAAFHMHARGALDYAP
jgi:hypothetical protein